MSRRASRCWTTPQQTQMLDRIRLERAARGRAAPDGVVGRALATVITLAATDLPGRGRRGDPQARRGARLDRARRRHRRRDASCRGRSASTARTRSSGRDARSSDGADASAVGVARGGGDAATGLEERSGAGRAADVQRRARPARNAPSSICGLFITDAGEPRKQRRHQAHSRRRIPSWPSACCGEQERVLCAARAPQAIIVPRPHRRAADHRRRGDRALSRREGARAACSTTTT